jgi:hypothetical protein
LHRDPSPAKNTFGEMRASGVRDALIYCRDHRSATRMPGQAACSAENRCGPEGCPTSQALEDSMDKQTMHEIWVLTLGGIMVEMPFVVIAALAFGGR